MLLRFGYIAFVAVLSLAQEPVVPADPPAESKPQALTFLLMAPEFQRR